MSMFLSVPRLLALFYRENPHENQSTKYLRSNDISYIDRINKIVTIVYDYYVSAVRKCFVYTYCCLVAKESKTDDLNSREILSTEWDGVR